MNWFSGLIIHSKIKTIVIDVLNTLFVPTKLFIKTST